MSTTNIHIISIIMCLLAFCTATPQAQAAPQKRFTVVIDPGHGGHDPGAVGRRGKEKNINLSVALKLGKLIGSLDDTEVIYTRKNDRFVALHERADIANKAKADLFISIHTNSIASRSSKVSGTETYTLGLHKTQENLEVAKKENAVILIESDYRTRYAGFNPNSSESYIIFEFMQDRNMSQSVNFARQIQHQFRNHARRVDKGVHQAGFLVLRETTMPSVLIELGYITNPSEEAYLLSESGSSALAQSIYQAFLKYKQHRGGVQKTAANTITEDFTADTTLPSAGDSDKIAPVESAAPATTVTDPAPAQETADTTQDRPVFKIQILTSDRLLSQKNKVFKGFSPIGHYKEKGIYKYTYGEDYNYNKILQLFRQKVRPRFKDAFIIAFKNGEKMNVNTAIKEYKQNKLR